LFITRVLWRVLVVVVCCDAPGSGRRGLWISDYFADVVGAPLSLMGTATLVMGWAMVAGNCLYGPIDRIVGSRKWAILSGNVVVVVVLLIFFAVPPGGTVLAIAMFAAIGVFGASYPAVMAHGRAFLPSHLTGRGVTLLNLFGMGGAGVMQFASGPGYLSLSGSLGAQAAYGALFAIIAGVIALCLLVYAFAEDR